MNSQRVLLFLKAYLVFSAVTLLWPAYVHFSVDQKALAGGLVLLCWLNFKLAVKKKEKRNPRDFMSLSGLNVVASAVAIFFYAAQLTSPGFVLSAVQLVLHLSVFLVLVTKRVSIQGL